MKNKIKLLAALLFFSFSLNAWAQKKAEETAKTEVKASEKKEPVKKTTKTKKQAAAKPSKKDKYIFKNEEDSTYKLDETANPLEEKKAKTKKKSKVKKLQKDYKNSVNNTPFKSYKFDENGNPILDSKKAKTQKTDSKKDEHSDLDLPIENQKIKTR